MKIIRILLTCLLVSLFVWGVYFIMSRQGEAISSNQTESASGASEDATPIPPAPMYDSAALQQSLQAIIAKYPGIETGIAVQAINEDIVTNVQDAEFIAASTTKAIVATHTLYQIEQGVISLDGTIKGVAVRDLLTKMIVNSDNNAWYTLLEYFGYAKITAYANANGAASYDAVANTITPNDMAAFLKNMHSGTLINQEHRKFLEGLMSQAYTGPIKLNETYSTLIRKAGWLEDRIHLVGIITVGEKSVAYAIYTKSASGGSYPSYTTGSALINEVLDAITAALQ